ncbi:hypothetical protein K0M31_001321 [Melipona bicolor]|uniref:Uncharacterized protein n=1 Tax=Melipona bicolor TaxID=60889 RepID=A0AA40GFF8_9HYME|nr:hypothetical protein K0M31_001321 [Melipona bicolor]
MEEKIEEDVNEEKRGKYAKKVRTKMNFELLPPLTLAIRRGDLALSKLNLRTRIDFDSSC